MFTNLRKEYEMARESGIFALEKDRLNKTEKGKFVICKCKEKNSSRLFLHRLSHIYTSMTKEGWWDTFTIGTKKCKYDGYYLCEIVEFRLDKNGWLNLLVNPKYCLGGYINEESSSWKFFMSSGLFSKEYVIPSKNLSSRLNVSNLLSHYSEKYDKYLEDNKEYYEKYGTLQAPAKFFVEMFINDEIELEDMDILLEEKFDDEKIIEEIFSQFKKGIGEYVEKYPLIYKRFVANDWMFESKLVDYINNAYYGIKKSSYTDNIVERMYFVEEQLNVYEEKKKKEKEEKKAKRLAKKQSK